MAPPAAADPEGETEELVTAAYAGLLGRTPDAAGLDFWTSTIDAGARPGDVVQVIGDSIEHRRFIVQGRYERILKRPPDAAGLDYWARSIIDAFTADELSVEILASREYFLRAGATNAGFLEALYGTVLNRGPDQAGLDYWVGLLDGGVSRRAVIREFLSSTEGILQPELSIESVTPRKLDLRTPSPILIDLDRPVDPDRSGVILTVDGERLAGSVSGDPDDPSILIFTPAESSPVEQPAAVLTVLAASPDADAGFVVESVGTTVGISSEFGTNGKEPTGELIVAFYGHPRTGVLGVAGEGTPQEAVQRLLAQARPYAVTGRPIVPAFEMISTLVTANPGLDGLYRSRASEAELRVYLDEIRTVDGRLILDIQPGRADVEAEARAYESLLLEPEVGLALDPEWVVGPNQTPKGRIGTLDAEAINRVSAYLSDLVTANDLPDKLLIIHRFKADMVTNTDAILGPPGVRILFHADGEGPPAAKIADYDHLMPPRFEKGIKIFYDEDSPTMTPAQLLERTNPDPTFISYQ